MRKWRWISSLRDLQLITERVKGRKKYGTILKCLEILLNFHSMVKYIYSRVMVLGIDRVKNSFSHLLVLCDPVFERSTNDYRKIVRHLLKIAPKFYLRIGTFRSLFVYLVKKELSCVSNLELGKSLFCGRDLPRLRLPSINCNL